MFYYYGAKNMLARYYPEPLEDLIIEPFAGSAAYTCYHLNKNSYKKALLIEKDEIVFNAWKYLLSCSYSDIANFKLPKVGEYSSDFLINTCAVSNAVSKCNKLKVTDRILKVFEAQRRRLLKYFHVRSRIEIILGDYSSVDHNLSATWFIDPPYQVLNKSNTVFSNGDGYSKNCNSSRLDYDKLRDFCYSIKGQLIVCEKEGANWLPFTKFRSTKTSLNKKYNEVIYTRDS